MWEFLMDMEMKEKERGTILRCEPSISSEAANLITKKHYFAISSSVISMLDGKKLGSHRNHLKQRFSLIYLSYAETTNFYAPPQTPSGLLELPGNGLQVDVSSSSTDPVNLDSISPTTAPEASELPGNQQNDLGANVMSSTAAPEVPTSMVPSSSTSNSASTVTAIDAPLAPDLVPSSATETSSSGLQEKNQEASGMIPPAPSVTHTTPATIQMHNLGDPRMNPKNFLLCYDFFSE
ncbi:hypothetical protein B9Z55_026550 [Caenorhabditis nigoni]|uniref:Uncharacterized protein n=1 Tax=Caenorhabditis nigoni TaxID=1611254 RepID=A0A2G5T3T3_9PELO|nr:hypothetical protein B9Z55_026550 [Caenorhabditis nigoni]